MLPDCNNNQSSDPEHEGGDSDSVSDGEEVQESSNQKKWIHTGRERETCQHRENRNPGRRKENQLARDSEPVLKSAVTRRTHVLSLKRKK